MKSDVSARVTILPKDSSYIFEGDWTFEIGGFKFQKASDSSLWVEFKFEAELVREDEKFGTVLTSPDNFDEEVLEKEYELETLLDVIALHTSVGLRIDIETYEFTYPRGSTSSSHSSKVNMPDIQAVKERYNHLLTASYELQDSLRFYRLNRLEEDGGERSTQLWNVIERLYGKQPGQSFLDAEELSALKEFIQQTDAIHDDKKEKLLEGIQFINPINTLDLLADRIKLKDQEGELSTDAKKKLLRDWKRLRGYHGHGRYVLRSENLQDVLWDFEDTVELLLEDNVTPKMYLAVAFKDGALVDDWKKSPSHYKKGDWNFVPVRGAALDNEIRILKNSVSRESSALVIDYKSVTEVTQSVAQERRIEELEETLADEVKEIQSKMTA